MVKWHKIYDMIVEKCRIRQLERCSGVAHGKNYIYGRGWTDQGHGRRIFAAVDRDYPKGQGEWT